MSKPRTWKTPTVYPVRVLPSAPVLAWVQGLADAHYAGDTEAYDDESTLSLAVNPLCASLGPVRKHIDFLDGDAAGKLVYGWVIRSDGHKVHTEDCPEGLLLQSGDLYCIDPLVPHWTTCPSPDSELIFAVAVTPPDSRTPKKLAQDFRMTIIVASIDQVRADRQARDNEALTFRGVSACD